MACYHSFITDLCANLDPSVCSIRELRCPRFLLTSFANRAQPEVANKHFPDGEGQELLRPLDNAQLSAKGCVVRSTLSP